jgi:HEAT repeat protein
MHITRILRRATFALAIIALCTASLRAADNQTAQDKERALIQTLQSDAPASDKAMACKQLSVYGSQQAVPELAKLLSNEQLASWARIALEAIPGPAADEALRNAASSLQGRLLVGTINSIGVRQDAAAVNVLASPLKSQDAEVASAAAVALGRIGNAAATKLLRGSLAGSTAEVRSSVAEGLVLCAERLMTAGQSAQAAEIYDELRNADLPKQRKIEATRGSILARKVEGIPLLVEQLRSPDKNFFQLGLGVARELSGGDVAKALAAEFAGAAPDRAVKLLYTLADLGNKSVLPAVMEATSSGPKPVRLAAIEIVPRLGDVSCVNPLLGLAASDDAELAAEAKTALAALPGEQVDADIKGQLASAQGKSLPVLIELVGLRRLDAKGDLLKAAEHPQAAVRGAALIALGQTIAPEDLSLLIHAALSPKHAEDSQVATQALRVACVRMPDRDACAEQLMAVMAGAPITTKTTLLETMAAMGGAKALEALATAAKSGDPQLQDTSTRVLGEWLNLDAAPVLLDLAKTLTEDKYQVRATRGYIRLARQFALNDKLRVEMCQKAYDAAKRTAEQKLVLDILARSSSMDALRLAVKAAEVPELKADAVRVATAIGQKIGDKPQARELLSKIRPEPAK